MAKENPFEFDDEPGFFEKYRGLIVVVVILALGGGAWFVLKPKEQKKSKRSSSVTMVMPALPPPPPPPKPEPTPPPPEPEQREEKPEDQEMVAQEPVAEDEPAPSDNPEPADEALGTNLEGEGTDYGLKKGGGMGPIGGSGKGGKGKGGSKYGRFAAQVQSRVAEALRSNKKTRSAVMEITVRVWSDASGIITRATLSGSSGNGEVDTAIQSQLVGLQFSEPPPADMPMPIVMRVKAARPR